VDAEEADAEEAPLLLQEHPEDPSDEAAASPAQRSPSKAQSTGDDPNDERWRCTANDGFAYLDEQDFASSDESGDGDGGGDERWLEGAQGASWGGLDASRDSDKESIELEYETRIGIDVIADEQQAAHRRAHQPARHGIQFALRPRSTHAAKLHTENVGGMELVCDPVLANTPAQERIAAKCRRGAQVVLVEGYARKEGLKNCLGLIGLLQRRASVDIHIYIYIYIYIYI
jgi:hypothetical protein